ncbi:MAG TPA: metallophosphoesterase [Candidatus Scatomorpha stercoravium]|nr:metallophosphoesterase [Candidatus Scatomorpha stercoravium]
MRRRHVLLIVILLALAALLAWAIWANGALTLTRVTLSSAEIPEEFRGFKIAHVSDLHNAVFGEGNRKLLSLLREAEPDIIAVTGDLADSRHTDTAAALDFAARAAGIAPVYYVTGNHEARLDFASIEAGLAAAGVRVLRSEAVTLSRGGAEITLAGIDDPAFVKSGAPASERAAELMEGLIPPEGFAILLAHRPELVETYAAYGADAVLSGHAHGGQIRLPIIGGLYAPGQGALPKYDSGLYTVSGCSLIVSRGLGNSVFPLRINNRPELLLITLE